MTNVVDLGNFYFYAHEGHEDDTFTPTILPVVLEEMTDEEAEEYVNSLTSEEAREHLNAHLTSEEDW
jgi:hypothetical protein